MRMKTVIVILVVMALSMNLYAQESVFKNFITVKDGRLMDGDKEFRFISFNIPNLNYVEDEFGYETKYPYRMPDTFEMTDALESIKQLGGRVIRVYTVPVKNIHGGDYPTYVLAPGKFDEESFKTMDTMLVLANKIGIRLILPFVNNWQWMGGRPQYADFRGKTKDEFWTDSTLIEDVKATIHFVINRTNTVSGVKYKDDKAILCWETGNELSCPSSWTETICRYIKSLDQNHLLMDGYTWDTVDKNSLNEPSVDIVTTHHYEDTPEHMMANLEKHLNVIDGKKAYIVGEFGFVSTPGTERFLDMIIKDRRIAGAMIWSLRYHRREGGFYWHSEPAGMGIYKAYHWPGFESGIEYDETNMLNLMREKAFEIQNEVVPQITPPDPPVLLPINEQSLISWQGSVGASFYDVERAESTNGPWQVIGYNVTDADAQYFPLFNDVKAEFGKKYYYCVIAKNSSGTSAPSNIIGPVQVVRKALIDDMKNYDTYFSKSGNVSIDTDNDRMFREKMYRLKCDSSSSVIYGVKGNLNELKVYAFAEKDIPSIEFYISSDNKEFKPIDFTRESLYPGKGDYGYWVPCTYDVKVPASENAVYIKLSIKTKTELARVEAFYTK